MGVAALGAMALLFPCKIFAQGDVYVLDTLLVSDKRSVGSSADSSVPLQYMDAEALRRLGVADAGDALKRFAGVTVKDYGGVGGLKTVSVRGMGAQHTAVFYDGVAVGDCQSGQVDLGRFSTDNLGGIRLVIGQPDDIYQPARMYASAGTVSLHTRQWHDNGMSVKAYAASFDGYGCSVDGAFTLGRGLKAALSGGYITSGGDYPFTLKNASGMMGAERNNSDVESMRGEADLSWSEGAHTLRAKMYGYCTSRGVPGAVIVDNPLSSERLLNRNFFGQVFYEYAPSAVLRMKAAFKHNYTFDRNRIPRQAATVDVNEYRQHETDFSYTVKWSPVAVEGLSMAYSGEFFRNTLETTNKHLLMAARPRRFTALSAVAVRFGTERFCATASLLHTHAEEQASDGDVAPRRSRLSPSLSLSYNPFGRWLSLRASYKDIFRLPTFNDLYYIETGNYRLRPEKSRMLNAGVVLDMPSHGMLKGAVLSVDAYTGSVKDKIVAVPGVFVWKMNNVGRARLSGVDASLAAHVAWGGCMMRLDAAYSYMYAVDDTDGSVVKGEQIIYTPRHSGSASFAFECPFFDAGYSLVWSGVRYRLPQNIPSNEVGAWHDHSLWISRTTTIGRCKLTARAEAINITDDNYEVVRYYPMPGRNFKFTIMLNF